MLKILRAVCAVLIMAAVYPVVAQARSGVAHGGAHHSGAHYLGAPRAYFGAGRFGAPARGARYYGGIYRRAGVAWHGSVWPNRYHEHYYGNWRQSFRPNWGWDVAADLLAAGPAYYYGVGFGDDYGFETPYYDDAIAYCMRRFRSYDPASGTYIGRDKNLHACP